jgi:hypothetical protein
MEAWAMDHSERAARIKQVPRLSLLCIAKQAPTMAWSVPV